MLHRGRVVLQLDKTVVQCKAVSFKGAEFTLGSQVHVHTSVNYFNESGPFVHDAAVTWIERVSTAGFSVCALKAGRNDRLTPDSGLTFVDYIACQGAPTGSMAGEVNITQWWEGTTCKIVDIPKVSIYIPQSSTKCSLHKLWILDFYLPCFHGPRASRLGHKRKEKTRSITCRTDLALG